MPKFDPKSIKLDSIHVMKNSDKGWHESWNKPRGRSMAAFPHPFTLCLLGIKNRGKTKYHSECIFTASNNLRPIQRIDCNRTK